MLPNSVREALLRLNEAGFEAWLVGGCVRDRLMGAEPHDYDITTSAIPEETEAVFAGERIIETGLRHGTVTVLLSGEPLEITTFRTEAAYSDHRRPDAVRFTRSLREDLARRDFTVNAIAMDADGRLCDPFGGRADLEKKILRAVGDPEARFREDALRILRCARFSSVLGFAIEPATAAAMVRCRELLAYVSAERIYTELTKLLCGQDVRRLLMDHTDVLGAVLPELLPMKGFDQRNFHHIYDVLEHTARVVENVPPAPRLRWAALFHDAGKPACFTLDEQGVGHFYGHAEKSRELADAALLRLKTDNATREAADQLIRYHDWPMEPTAAVVRRALNKLGPEGLRDLIALKRADNLAQAPEFRDRQRTCDEIEALAAQIIAEQQAFSLKDLAINGGDLRALGIPPGPDMGRVLNELLDAVISDRLPNEREALLNEARVRLMD